MVLFWTKKMSYKAIVILSGVILSGEHCNISLPVCRYPLLRRTLRRCTTFSHQPSNSLNYHVCRLYLMSRFGTCVNEGGGGGSGGTEKVCYIHTAGFTCPISKRRYRSNNLAAANAAAPPFVRGGSMQSMWSCGAELNRQSACRQTDRRGSGDSIYDVHIILRFFYPFHLTVRKIYSSLRLIRKFAACLPPLPP